MNNLDYHVLIPLDEYDRMKSIIDVVQTELPHIEKVIRDLESQGLCAGTLPDIYRALNEHRMC